MRYDWHDHGWGAGNWIAMGLMMLLFWGLIAALVVYVVRSLGTRRDDAAPTTSGRDAALAILDERFARGEIDAEEYEQRRRLLRSG